MASKDGFIAGLLDAAQHRLRWRAKPRGYVICATPRSGSNYLCQLLASTGVLGVPREYFNAPGRRAYDDPNYPEDPHQQLAQITSTGATPNGIYAFKVHPFQLEGLKGTIDPFRELPKLRVVRLLRNDLLGQAISWWRAQQTGQHRASDSALKTAEYDEGHIRESLEFIQSQNGYWRDHLRNLGLTALDIAYEDLCRNPQAQIDRVAAYLGVRQAARVDASLVSVTAQRNQTTENWRQRFLAESRADTSPL
jgi:LPS sulfotransferase NodH